MGESRVLRTFAPEDVSTIRGLAALAEAEPEATVGALGDLTWRGLSGSSSGTELGVLAGEAGGTPRGYAHASRQRAGEWTIELLDRGGAADGAGELLGDAVELVAAEGGGHVTVWADSVDGIPDEIARAAKQEGFAAERELLQLRVDLPVEPPRWPAGITTRTFAIGQDEAAWVAVNNRSFAGHPEQGDWTVAMLEAREDEPWFDPTGFLLAVADESLAGFCWTKVHPADPPREPSAMGEIYVIGVDPAHQGIGLGRALVTGGLASLFARGLTLGMLYVDAANSTAVALYRALGFREHLRHVAFGTTVTPR